MGRWCLIPDTFSMANSIDRTLPSQLAKPEPLRPNHDSNKEASLSIVRGPDTPALWTQTLAELIDERGQGPNGERTAVVFSWQQHHTLSYRQLAERSKLLAKSMLEAGLKQGDHIGIIAGNCYQYIEVFLGAARIGCPLVVLNNTYSVSELCTALSVSGKLSLMVQCLHHLVC
jgi:acyl-CoA synthetase (AMP-forming)/AMP-acid ligase II